MSGQVYECSGCRCLVALTPNVRHWNHVDKSPEAEARSCFGLVAENGTPYYPVLRQDAPEEEVRMTSTTGGQKGVKPERFDLLPWGALQDVARVYGFGASKYGDDNWRKGYKWGWSFGALMRHLTSFWLGENNDKESGLPHLAHATFHCLALMTFVSEKLGEDNRK